MERKILNHESAGKGIVLLSGGLDSATVAAIALSRNYEIIGLSFDYGQRHKIEIEMSKNLSKFYHIKHHIFNVNLKQIGGSSLTSNMPVEKGDINRKSNDIPNTYVPSRNIIFLSIAASLAETLNVDNIFIGANVLDYSGYPDCRPDFFDAMEKAINLGTQRGLSSGFKIQVPLQYMKKSEIIKMGISLGVPYEMTHSCYEGGKKSCGKCDSCLLRLRGFMEAGFKDPVKYENYPDFYLQYAGMRD
ncbi:MAG: 7-cyano-7-deazaguanine synthase QueC [Thermoplasmataceae archaeon]